MEKEKRMLIDLPVETEKTIIALAEKERTTKKAYIENIVIKHAKKASK